MVSDRMRTAYDTIAEEFADRFAVMPPALERFGNEFLERLPDTPVILDAGCGHGRDMAWFESKDCTVTGIDLSPAMLAQARTRVTGSLLEMDLQDLHLDDEAYDGIWCNAALLHVPKAKFPVVVAGFRNALRPGGILGLGLKRGNSEGWVSGNYQDVERYFSLFEEEELRRLLEESGFVVNALAMHPGKNVTWIHVIASRSQAG